MAYSDFRTPEESITAFRLVLQNRALFQGIAPIDPSPFLLQQLEDLPIATDNSTEKIRNELIVSPILREVCRRFDNKIGYFSGRSLNVDPSIGLNGECDFILSGAPGSVVIQAPLLTIVEAKDADLKLGLGQCIAQMVAAQRFNQQQRQGFDGLVHGAVTTGVQWRFLQLHQEVITIDTGLYTVPFELPLLLGVLCQPFQEFFQASGSFA